MTLKRTFTTKPDPYSDDALWPYPFPPVSPALCSWCKEDVLSGKRITPELRGKYFQEFLAENAVLRPDKESFYRPVSAGEDLQALESQGLLLFEHSLLLEFPFLLGMPDFDAWYESLPLLPAPAGRGHTKKECKRRKAQRKKERKARRKNRR